MKITDLDEGFGDLISRGAQALGLNNIGNMVGKTQADATTVDRKAKELLDSGMPEPQIIQTLQQEFGINPRAATQSVRIAAATMESDNFDLSPQQRKIANLGRVLMDQATTTKNDELANVMAKVGNELTNFGANFGPKNLKDLVSKTDVPAPVIQKLLAYADKILTAQTNLQKDQKDGGLNDSMYETTSAGAVATVATPVGGLISRSQYNADGTAKNALDQDNILSNGKPKKKNSKRSKDK
jgi:hypothetical protein